MKAIGTALAVVLMFGITMLLTQHAVSTAHGQVLFPDGYRVSTGTPITGAAINPASITLSGATGTNVILFSNAGAQLNFNNGQNWVADNGGWANFNGNGVQVSTSGGLDTNANGQLQLGATNATSVVMHGGSPTGFATLETLSQVIAATDYGGFTIHSAMAGAKLGELTCTVLTTAGSGTAGTIKIVDVDNSNNQICAPNQGAINCGGSVDVPVDMGNCNQSGVTTGHRMAMQWSGCTTYPKGVSCQLEWTH